MRSFLAKVWLFLHLPKHFQLFVMRMFHDQFLVGVAGIIFDQNNQILLFKHTYREKDWGLPSGYIKAGEHPREGLEREIEEESGLTVSIDKAFRIRTDRENARLEVCYLGTFLGGEFRKSDEVSQAKFFAFEDLPLIPRQQFVLLESAVRKREKDDTNQRFYSRWKFLEKLH